MFLVQGQCKPNAIELVRIAEAPPVLAVETCFRRQRYEVWKYYPNFLRNSENIPKFATGKENLSDSGLSLAS